MSSEVGENISEAEMKEMIAMFGREDGRSLTLEDFRQILEEDDTSPSPKSKDKSDHSTSKELRSNKK